MKLNKSFKTLGWKNQLKESHKKRPFNAIKRQERKTSDASSVAGSCAKPGRGTPKLQGSLESSSEFEATAPSTKAR